MFRSEGRGRFVSSKRKKEWVVVLIRFWQDSLLTAERIATMGNDNVRPLESTSDCRPIPPLMRFASEIWTCWSNLFATLDLVISARVGTLVNSSETIMEDIFTPSLWIDASSSSNRFSHRFNSDCLSLPAMKRLDVNSVYCRYLEVIVNTVDSYYVIDHVDFWVTWHDFFIVGADAF